MKKIVRALILIFVVASLLISAALASSGKVITTGDVNLRSGPGTGFIKLGAVPKGITVSYLDSVSGWYYVGYNGKYGWISASYAKETGDHPTSGSLTITGNAYMRKQPFLEGDIITTLKKGTIVPYNGVSTDDRGVDWYSVYYDYDYGWVSSANAKPAKPSGNNVYATGNAYVRNAPNLNASDFGVLHKGESAVFANATSTDGRGVVWYKVFFDGSTGWISSKNAELRW